MKKAAMRTAKSLAAGIAAGTAVSVITMLSMKPKPVKVFRKKASQALDAVGAVMMSLADYAK